jgi:CubicO group peptidase (beta-lactamase class C family)
MKRLYRLKTILTAILLLVFVSSAIADKKTDAVDKLFSQWDKKDSPGCALAVVKDGKIIYKQGYGLANLELNIPITPQSVFYIGSVSKQFVTMCIALLAKQKKLSLDDDIRKFVPELPDYGPPITVRHLIHHTSGLRDYLTLLGIAGIDYGTYHQDDVVELVARQRELNFAPGEEYLYSNSGYFLLAVIAERASGKSLREFAEENIFKPLGMKNSHFHDDYRMLIKKRASGYFPDGKGKYRNFISTFDCVGSGGLFTSVEDLFLWDQNFYHHKVGGKI